MAHFIDARGNLLEADVDALVNTVNTVGVMGKGIALQFKNAFPANFKAYEQACKHDAVALGAMFVFDNGQLTKPRWIVNFPTKGHWRSRSRLEDVKAGLEDLRSVVTELGIASIAIPPLGCGNGGLDWAIVRPLIEDTLQGLAQVEVYLFAPAGTPAASDMVVSTPRPELTPGKAALVSMIDRYSRVALGTTLIETQKLMYLLQVAGEPLRLQYEPHRYGPYADNLRHVLKAVEGHYLEGFGDGSAGVHDAEPIRVLPGAAETATNALSSEETLSRIERVFDLIEGYESAYGLELLATSHWAATHSTDGNCLDEVVDRVNKVVERVQNWNERKRRMFTEDHIEKAWIRLRDKGWLAQEPAMA